MDRSKNRFNMKRISPQQGNSPKSMTNVQVDKGSQSSVGHTTVLPGKFKGSIRLK